jgi:glutamate dehydrogenase
MPSTLNIGRHAEDAAGKPHLRPADYLRGASRCNAALTDIANARRDLATVVLTRHKGDKALACGHGKQADDPKLARRDWPIFRAASETGEATLAVSVAAGVLSDLAQERAT